MEDDAPPGVPEWVVTYGDMMSLLLTFFIMLVSMSEVNANKKYRAVLESLIHQFGYPAGPVAPSGENFPLNSLAERRTTLGAHLDADRGKGGLRRLSLDGPDVRVFRNREGEPVPAGSVPFPPGSAELTPDGRRDLAQIVARLAGKPNKIDVCGVGIKPQAGASGGIAGTRLPLEAPRPGRMAAPTDLAYRRAKAVASALEAAGIRHERLRITTLLEAASDAVRTGASDRADVTVLDAYAVEFLGPRAE